MTKFVSAAKRLILLTLDETMANAGSADRSWFASVTRNIDLSKKQVEKTIELRRRIEDFKAEPSDKDNLDKLKKLILKTDQDVEYLRRASKFDRGNLNQALININSNLDLFFATIERLTDTSVDIGNEDNPQLVPPYKLLDMDASGENSPFTILCTAVLYYFGLNIFFPRSDSNMIAKTLEYMSGSSFVDIRFQKERCLLKHITVCDRNLASIKEGSQYDRHRLERVVLTVSQIESENEKICTGAQVIPKIPVDVSVATATVSAGSVKPSRGRLRTCMTEVSEQIKQQNLHKGKEPVHEADEAEASASYSM